MYLCLLLRMLSHVHVQRIMRVPKPSRKRKFNLNTIDAIRLALILKGVGEKRAAAIVQYRKQHGAFQSINDLAHVKGIGPHFVKQHWEELNKQFSVS